MVKSFLSSEYQGVVEQCAIFSLWPLRVFFTLRYVRCSRNDMIKNMCAVDTGTVLWAWHKNFPICIYNFQKMLWLWSCLFYHAEPWELSYENMRNEMNMSACHYDWWKEMEMYTKECVLVYMSWYENCDMKRWEMKWKRMYGIMIDEKKWKCMQSECVFMAWE